MLEQSCRVKGLFGCCLRLPHLTFGKLWLWWKVWQVKSRPHCDKVCHENEYIISVTGAKKVWRTIVIGSKPNSCQKPLALLTLWRDNFGPICLPGLSWPGRMSRACVFSGRPDWCNSFCLVDLCLLGLIYKDVVCLPVLHWRGHTSATPAHHLRMRSSSAGARDSRAQEKRKFGSPWPSSMVIWISCYTCFHAVQANKNIQLHYQAYL